ncbi:MAG TPA: metal-dependent transcriptional regulator, partial [Flavobacterium sp.]|nr:metal-dependent transcriptional regulator [Flavobacterium sp.]
MTLSEENYLKTIYHLSTAGVGVSTNAIAARMETKASSVTDMIRKLSGKQLVTYVKYKGVELTPKGRLAATMVVRKHRLWEVFLVDKLGFTWGEVHDVAEELEHIKSEKLINKLDEFLGYPKSDPHGDPIPSPGQHLESMEAVQLSTLGAGQDVVI